MEAKGLARVLQAPADPMEPHKGWSMIPHNSVIARDSSEVSQVQKTTKSTKNTRLFVPNRFVCRAHFLVRSTNQVRWWTKIFVIRFGLQFYYFLLFSDLEIKHYSHNKSHKKENGK